MKPKVIRGPWPQQPKRESPIPDPKLVQNLFRRSHRDQIYRQRFIAIYRANNLAEGSKP